MSDRLEQFPTDDPSHKKNEGGIHDAYEQNDGGLWLPKDFENKKEEDVGAQAERKDSDLEDTNDLENTDDLDKVGGLESKESPEKNSDFNKLSEALLQEQAIFVEWLGNLTTAQKKLLFNSETAPTYKECLQKEEEILDNLRSSSAKPGADNSEPTTKEDEHTAENDIAKKEQPKQETAPIKKDSPEEKKNSSIALPIFDPKESFATFTIDDFDPDKPFKKHKKGRSAKAQFVHSTYRKGFGRAGLNIEGKISVEDATKELQEQEKIALLSYYSELINSIEEQGGDLESPAIIEKIQEAMVEAKKVLERYIVNNYGSKVYQERRSNWWRRFRNFLNSDVLERRTLGDASDLVAINSGNRENTVATVKNLKTSELIKRMNAHVRRSTKKSLDWSGNKDGYMPADNEKYDRHETYNILLGEYSQRMAEAIEGNNEELSPEEQVAKILEIQKPRLETIEKDVNKKRIRNLKNILVAGASTLVLGGLLAGIGTESVKAKMVDKMNKDTHVKIELAIDQTGGDENAEKLPVEDESQEEESNDKEQLKQAEEDVKRILTEPAPKKISHENLDKINKLYKETHRKLSQIQVTMEGVPDDYISPAATRSQLEETLNTWNSLDDADKKRFNKHVNTSPNYKPLAEGMQEDNDIGTYLERTLQELQ